MRSRLQRRCAAALIAVLAGIGGTALFEGHGVAVGAPAPAAQGPAGPAAAAAADWTRFGYDARRTNAAPGGLKASEIDGLVEKRITLPGTVDSSPIFLNEVEVGGERRDLLVMQTTYGIALGLDPVSGRILWRFTPASYASVAGTSQITTASPVADPNRRFVYTSSPDGLIHKLRVSDGHDVTSGSWPALITKDAKQEKINSALNLDRGYVLATTSGYFDNAPYQGKVVAISRTTGEITGVVNSMCSDRHRIIDPQSCRTGSSIFGRAAAVVDPATHRIYATTGNGKFDGRRYWGDSVLELAPGVTKLKRHFTPTNQRVLDVGDLDLGSTAPALLPAPHSGSRVRFLLQGGKDPKLYLLKLRSSLYRASGKAGRRLGGEVEIRPTPGKAFMYTAPAVMHQPGSTQVFVTTERGTVAYKLVQGRLRRTWHKPTPGTSPVIAGSLLWVYDLNGALNVYRSRSGRLLRRLPAPAGHWNSPIIVGGRVYLPSGDGNDRATSGVLSIYHAG